MADIMELFIQYKIIKLLYKLSILFMLYHKPFPTADTLAVNTNLKFTVANWMFRGRPTHQNLSKNFGQEILRLTYIFNRLICQVDLYAAIYEHSFSMGILSWCNG